MLAKHNNALSGKLQVAGVADRAVNLSITKERAVAWTIPDEKDNEKLERLVKGVFLLGMLNQFPDERKSRAEQFGDFQLTNLGVAKRDGELFYVVRAKPKAKASNSGRNSSLQADRIQIAFASSDLQPLQITAFSKDGTVLVLNLESITNDVQEKPQQTGPPKEAFVIDLSDSPAGDGALKNPVPYTPESIKRGKQLYIADCEVCHSVDGTGRDSDVTDNAADLTSTEFWLSDGSEAASFLAIRDGAGDEMPGYKDDYRDEKMIWDLVNYIRSIQK
jgi:mono/diheme cytochrome c family protein